MTDTNTLTLATDKAGYQVGDVITINQSGEYVRDWTETVDPAAVTTDLGGGDTLTDDVPAHPVAHHDNLNPIFPNPFFIDSVGRQWTTQPGGRTATHATTASRPAESVSFPVRLDDGSTYTLVKPLPAINPLPAPPPGWTPKFAGDVKPGFNRWGCAIDGNADPKYHESPAGHALGLRRTFWAWNNASMIATAKADIAAGRLPWVSVKTPGWAAVAAGTYDAQLDSMLKQLNALGGPVWFTVHHEPENDDFTTGAAKGGAPVWIAMQKHVRSRIVATGAKNVAFASILMSWTFDARSGRKPADWWVDGVWDFCGIDHYISSATPTSITTSTMWTGAHSFYTAKGIKVALGEWGNRGTDAQAAKEMQDFYNFACASGTSGKSQVIGQSYFDSGLNSPSGSWELAGEPLTKFRALLSAPTSLPASKTGA
jgi:hypothetical protein